jgi:xanthocillin biosynthesis cytochrome P450 monooxygenase
MIFDPSRWGTTSEAMNAKFPRDSVSGNYIPYNSQSRKCLGQGFALLERKIVLFELIRRTK